MFRPYLRFFIPEYFRALRRKHEQEVLKARITRLPALSEERFREILSEHLGIRTGDTLFIHSSTDHLHLGFPFHRILAILQDLVGENGTLVFPTYPKLPSYEFLQKKEIFDSRKTPSYTGLLTEFARRQKGAIRSLHPTKSVCALGQYAQKLTNEHHLSPFPYSDKSPYSKIMAFGGKIIGIGVSTKYLSFVHCIDDAFGENFPVSPYYDELFRSTCINASGEKIEVPTFAHNPLKMNHAIPEFLKRYVENKICEEFSLDGMNFYRADAKALFERMCALAEQNITIYPKISYRWSKIL